MGYEYAEPPALMSIMPAFDPWPTYAAAMGYEYDEPLALMCIMPAINSWHRCAAATATDMAHRWCRDDLSKLI